MTAPTANGVIEAVQPVLDCLLKLRAQLSENRDISLNSARGRILDLMHEAEARLEKLPGMRARIETAKYITAALVDETLIFSKWRHAEEWKKESLEKEIFNTNVSGERFFELLEKEGLLDPELAELFYTCLCLGFRRKRADTAEMKQKLYMMISSRLPDDERHLSPGARQAVRAPESRLPLLFGVWGTLIVIGLFFALYLTAGQWIWNDAAELIHTTRLRFIKG